MNIFEMMNWINQNFSNDSQVEKQVLYLTCVDPLVFNIFENYIMHQSMDPPDAGWNMIKGWFDDDEAEDDTVDTKIPEGHCPKCGSKMRELNTGFRKRMYACPKCDK